MAKRGGVGEEKRSEHLALVRIGADVAFVVDGEVFGLRSRSTSDVAIDVRCARFIGQIVKAEAELAVAAQTARWFRASDEACERGALRDQEVVVVVENRARDGGSDDVARLGGSRIKRRDEACEDGDGVGGSGGGQRSGCRLR